MFKTKIVFLTKIFSSEYIRYEKNAIDLHDTYAYMYNYIILYISI